MGFVRGPSGQKSLVFQWNVLKTDITTTPLVRVLAIEDETIADEFEIVGLTVAAQDLRPYGSVFDYDLLVEKIRTLLFMAMEAGCDSLVLGALGCGAFRNPPDAVARAFADVLASDDFKNVFHRVDFAIILSQNNLEAFQKGFC
eukprot:PhM_4_TR5308/c0_g1_i2/m.25046